jgi:hypothetical protein
MLTPFHRISSILGSFWRLEFPYLLVPPFSGRSERTNNHSDGEAAQNTKYTEVNENRQGIISGDIQEVTARRRTENSGEEAVS